MTSVDLVVRASLEVLARHGRTFRLAAYFLPRPLRDDAAIAYAFCRMVDDSVDETRDTLAAQDALRRIEGMLNGELDRTPLVAAYVAMAERLGFGLEPARDLLRGAGTDLGPVRLETDQELALYCYRVAGTVGVMMCGILRVSAPEARTFAIDLGMAMQLTNICRDVREDAARDRVYLPGRRLRSAGLDPELLIAGLGADAEPAVRVVVQDMLLAAELTYIRAARGFPLLPWRARLAIMIAAALYRGIGRRLVRAHQANPLHGRTVVPPSEKLWHGLGAVMQFLRLLLTTLGHRLLGRRGSPGLSAGQPRRMTT